MPTKDFWTSLMNVAYLAVLSTMNEDELTEHIAVLRADLARLAELHRRDRVTWYAPGPDGHPLGKLRPRIESTRARWNACRERLAAAESNLLIRRSRRQLDWDEPTETDMERLSGKLRAS